jgi:hypothetical protein
MNGDVYGHPLIPDGDRVFTTKVETAGDGFVRTRNRIYRLGSPCVSYSDWLLRAE